MTSGNPTKETPEELEARLRAALIAGKEKKAAEEVALAKRKEKFAVHLELQQKGQADKDRIQGGYYSGFTAARETVELDGGGSWSKHYDNPETDADWAFKALVDARASLDKYVAEVVQGADSSCLSFRAGDRSGQLSTFRLELWTYWGNDRYNGMTIAGAVYKTKVLIFHAGPGS
jgi:hypothetical protein